ncbi:MAG: hypothetical protein MK075_08140, partial [Phycisphaerales bacterium]|nr:hypothetical protein [Phycisphaerales bacterium]
IATSSAAMILSAPLGAYRKVWTLPEMSDLEGPITAAITTAAYMAVGAVVGARIGAGLTGKVPIRWIRAVFAALLAWVSWRFLVG